MTPSVRFAPSPTGLLHVGNARLALVNWLFARSGGGTFLMRLDDTDLERSRPEYADAILADMRWMGLDWDAFARETDRTDRYAAAEAALIASGRLYACWETPEELELKRAALVARARPPIYDRAGTRVTAEERARFEAEGRRPHWRFLLDHEPVEWTDLVRGPQRFHGRDLSDPVLIREDGRPLYTLSSVVDDAELGISHVIRGEDHVTNTAVQIQIFRALGATEPLFAHLPLLTDAKGGGLSKRLGSFSVKSMRETDGIEAPALLSLLAKLGTSDAIEPRLTLGELVAEFDMSKVSRSTARFDDEELRRLNARVLHLTSFETVRDRLVAEVGEGVDERFWNAVRPNLARLADARGWWDVARGAIAPVIGDPAFLAEAVAVLPPEPWDETTWSTWVGAVKARTGRGGKSLFGPLRLALTGLDHGPELKSLLPLMGRRRVLARMGGEVG